MESNVPGAAEDGSNEATKVLLGRNPAQQGWHIQWGGKEAWVCVSQVTVGTIEPGKAIHQNPSILQQRGWTRRLSH